MKLITIILLGTLIFYFPNLSQWETTYRPEQGRIQGGGVLGVSPPPPPPHTHTLFGDPQTSYRVKEKKPSHAYMHMYTPHFRTLQLPRPPPPPPPISKSATPGPIGPFFRE